MTEPRRTSRPRATGVGSITDATAGTVRRDRVAELEARLAKLESGPRLRERGRSLMDKVMPAEASEHFRNAGREHLLGVRTIVDHWISRLDDADTRAAGRARDGGREKIEIE